MNNKISLVVLALLSISLGYSQKVVTLISNGTHSFYKSSNPFSDAYTAAVDGDTIILPGGTFNSVSINKGITILGDGYRPDSTTANEQTIINGAFTIYENADNLHLEGLYFNSSISTYSNQKVDSLTIKRCEVVGSITFTGSRITPCHSPVIAECILHANIDCSNTYNALITNNITNASIAHIYDASVRNNIFLGDGQYQGYPYYTNACIFGGSYSLIANNIFNGTTGVGVLDNTTYCVIQNNVLVITLGTYTNNTVTSNYDSQIQSSLFNNNIGITTYDYLSDFNLQTPGSYVGDDGGECGIYGGVYPFKDGGLPFQPHYIEQTIDQFTDPSGLINVNIKVSSQDH